jgi:hypothetical protein
MRQDCGLYLVFAKPGGFAWAFYSGGRRGVPDFKMKKRPELATPQVKFSEKD